MTILKPAPTSTRQLHWVPQTRCFLGEISETNGFGRVFDDACDVGLTLVSARTGREVVFVIDHSELDSEGDVMFWDLVPAHQLGGTPSMRVRLFND